MHIRNNFTSEMDTSGIQISAPGRKGAGFECMIGLKYIVQREGTVPESKGVSLYVEKRNTAIWEHCIAKDHSNVCIATKTD